MTDLQKMKIAGNIIDVLNTKIYPGTLIVSDGRIVDIIPQTGTYDRFILPGFIDSHIHIESSMLTPHEFSRIAVTHGTVGAVCDPHEIANVLGMEGIEYMMADGGKSPLKFYFGAPSCVPATAFETAGAMLGPDEVERLMRLDEVLFLGEVMNYPGVIAGQADLMKKIETAKRLGKVVDGHAPCLSGQGLRCYIASGISSDHESLDIIEAREKIGLGMKIQIRQGSAAGSFETLHPLIDESCSMCMFCSDDLHPDDLVNGHINNIVRKAIGLGHDPMKVLRCACMNPVEHYGLDIGLLQKGDCADFIIIDSLDKCNVLETYIDGLKVAEKGRTLIERNPLRLVNIFNTHCKDEASFKIKACSGNARIIDAVDGSLVTEKFFDRPRTDQGYAVPDTDKDILKITVVNRYKDAPPALGFVRGFGLSKGAIASSVAHDSHNIISVGTNDMDICKAVNMVIESRGGLAVVYDDVQKILPLPVAGLMSDMDGWAVAGQYKDLDSLVKGMGSTLSSPFIALSFMALLVIPRLKISDKGLFDSESFAFTGVFD